MMTDVRLNEAQRDGRACIMCAKDTGVMRPVGFLDGVQVFVHHAVGCEALRGTCPECHGIRLVQVEGTPKTLELCPKCQGPHRELNRHAHELAELEVVFAQTAAVRAGYELGVRHAQETARAIRIEAGTAPRLEEERK